ncbi:23S rRNA (pseudouridine(1915)-N(3))-methyltransferase RlmH [Hyphococcus flavus]|uniref:Ribosomal RNA large subunit methyltransferase H n=1 Tax=Hyphococcus flavus TaxID=1866326 RepID=A0AAE9ZHV6_9PROT|nr:23S rRNA (pseudouridine(1915)-N(3))-methyltransferase RlmH [Hyphococcus flavus]WDI32902.1 23S rRNA (pseudouridine(1915)-N(3))-methyltransferase RlmH [Hyphococcus flavus]
MRLIIAAVGKMRSAPGAAMVEDYLNRSAGMGKSLGFSAIKLFEKEAPKSLSGAALTDREGELLIGAVPERAEVAVLDERGKNFSSESMAEYLDHLRLAGRDVAFLIGGADGHGSDVKGRADKLISFGAATWPHMLVRVMLAEQLYRAITILAGHPYHRS